MLHYLVLPAVALGFQSAALVARTTRSSLLAVLGEDYMRTARAKGLPERQVLREHAFRNALVPILAVLGLFFGQLLGGRGRRRDRVRAAGPRQAAGRRDPVP